ncbi:phosphopantetheine-binding protein [Agrobacterium radiobacter]|uniref:phosphopantetheine-binding protein n=1 Tax=Agrobacterium radiobacter TaxID=362 RepID=UPI001605D5FF|nr:phosphopantetheine-binding protein [Agrobacterium radiobacter]MBB4407714.1 aryl carrier-like protein [Agrobacterium radiobacter]MBB4453085.1 aryl carrier-like protein [Agrobacterium radiobacter]
MNEPGIAAGAMLEAKTMMTELKALLARVLDDEVRDIEPGDNLFGRGLHSLALMRLMPPLSQLAGTRLDYDDLARQPTLAAWQALIERSRAGH